MADEEVLGALSRIQSELAAQIDTADQLGEPHLAALLSEAKWCVDRLIESRL